MTFKNKIIAGFGAALAILIFVGVGSFRTMKRNREDIAMGKAWKRRNEGKLKGNLLLQSIG
jgi:hypothetical protein